MPKPTFHNLDEDRRQRVIDAAVAEFSTVPFAAASVNRIVKGADIAKGSFYQYFADLIDLYRWLVLEHLGARKLAFIKGQGAPPPGGDLFDQLRWTASMGLRWGLAEPGLAACGRQLMSAAPQPGLEALQAELQGIAHQQLRHIFAAGQAQGVVRQDLDLDLAVALVQAILRDGLDAALKQRVGLTVADLCTEPARAREVDEADLDAVVSAVMDVLRRAFGTGAGGGHLDLDALPFPAQEGR